VSGLTLERDAGSIVLLGRLNPAIFQPQWFVNQGLIRSFGGEDGDKLEVVSPAVTAFSTGTFRLLVQQEQFSITSHGADGLEPIRDLVIGTFERLEHTPIAKMGINRHMHFQAPSSTEWHAIGDRLAPKEPWRGIVDKPGLLSIQMQCRRPDGTGGMLNVTVKPSAVLPQGVSVMTNDHYDRDERPAVDTMSLLADEFSRSMSFALQVATKLTEVTT
jgi:hypothetical protein